MTSSPTAIFYVDLGKSVTVVGSTQQIHFSANVTGHGRQEAGVFSWFLHNSEFSENNHEPCLPDSEAPVPTAPWISATEGSTGFTSPVSFSDLTGHLGGIVLFVVEAICFSTDHFRSLGQLKRMARCDECVRTLSSCESFSLVLWFARTIMHSMAIKAKSA